MKIEFYSEKFKEFRIKKGFTVKGLAETSEISRKSLTVWEKGVRPPSPKYIRILAGILNIDVSDISSMESENKLSKIDLSSTSESWHMHINNKNALDQQINMALKTMISLSNELHQVNYILKAINSTLDSIFYVKDKNLKYVFVNKAFLQNVSLPEKYNVLGKVDGDFFGEREAKENKIEDEKVLLTGSKIIHKESYMPNTRKKRVCLKSKIPIFDSNGNSAGLVGLFTDITDQKKEEQNRILLEKVIDGVRSYIFVIKKTNNINLPLKLLFINEKTLHFIKKRKSKIVDLTDLWVRTLPEHYNKMTEKISSSKKFPINYKFFIKKPFSPGKLYVSETVYNPFGDYFLAISRDITAQEPDNIDNIVLRLRERGVDLETISYATRIPLSEIGE